MKFSPSKWLVYTFLVGLIPVLTRLLAWVTTTNGTVTPLAAPDFVAFGLILHVSIVNELEHLPAKDREWKTVQNGTSVIFIALYSSLYALTIIGEKSGQLIDSTVMLRSSIAMAAVSALLSLAVFYRVTKLGQK